MYMHSRCQSRVVYLVDTCDGMSRNEILPPFSVDSFVVWQEKHARFQCPNFAFGVFDRQSKAIAGKRSSHRIPQLRYVLVSVVKGNTWPS